VGYTDLSNLLDTMDDRSLAIRVNLFGQSRNYND